MVRVGGLWVIGLVVVAAFAGCGGDKDVAQVEGAFVGEPQTVVGKVGDATVRLEEVDKQVARMKAQRSPDAGGLSDREMQRRALDNIIDRLLLLQAAEKEGMLPDETFTRQYMEDMKSRFPSPEAFQARLLQEGLTEDQLFGEIRKDLAISSYMREASPDTAQISPAEARSYYDGHPEEFQTAEMAHARHILVQVEPTATDDLKARAREKAERLLLRVKRGEDFATVARDSSDCPSASRGGDLGFFGRGQMVPSFEQAAFALEPGGVSEVVETQFGFHIIRLEEKKAPSAIPYDPNLEGQLTGYLKQLRQKEIFEKRLEHLRETAKIEKKL